MSTNWIRNCFIYSDAFSKCNKTYFTKYIHQSVISPPLFVFLLFHLHFFFYNGQKFRSFFASDFKNKPVLIKVYVDQYRVTDRDIKNLATSRAELLDEDKYTLLDVQSSQSSSSDGLSISSTLIIHNPEYLLRLRINVEKPICPAGLQ